MAPSPASEKRAAFAASLLPEGLCILDIGCGAMDFERFAKPREYRPVDRVARDARTHITDVVEQGLPAEWLKGCDLASLLGVVDDIPDPRPVFAVLAATDCATLFTYHPTDLSPEHSGRRKWTSHFSTAELESMLAEVGLEIAKRFNVDPYQRIYLCHPSQRAPQWMTQPQPYPSLENGRKPTLAVAGFYARGNCGDEALLQCVCESMGSDFDILISLDEHGAYPGYWDWYPYDRFSRTHQTNMVFLQWNKAYAGLLVGGGGLPFGFAANQAIHARSLHAATALAGVDFPRKRLDPRLSTSLQEEAHASSTKQYGELFDFRALRTEASLRSAARSGLDYFHGGDWALKLPMDAAPAIGKSDRRALLVLREVSLRFLDHAYVRQVSRLIAALEDRGLEPHFLPFAPEDERFLSQIGLDRRLPVIRTWWNARRTKQWIASSGLTLSIGRLHPLIFAAPTTARIACITNSEGVLESSPVHSETHSCKLVAACQELGIRAFSTIEEALSGLDLVGPADVEQVDLATFRLETMTERLRRLFRESAATRTTSFS